MMSLVPIALSHASGASISASGVPPVWPELCSPYSSPKRASFWITPAATHSQDHPVAIVADNAAVLRHRQVLTVPVLHPGLASRAADMQPAALTADLPYLLDQPVGKVRHSGGPPGQDGAVLLAALQRGYRLARVQQAGGVKSLLQASKLVELRVAELYRHLIDLFPANAVLAGNGAAHSNASLEDVRAQPLRSREFTGRALEQDPSSEYYAEQLARFEEAAAEE